MGDMIEVEVEVEVEVGIVVEVVAEVGIVQGVALVVATVVWGQKDLNEYHCVQGREGQVGKLLSFLQRVSIFFDLLLTTNHEYQHLPCPT